MQRDKESDDEITYIRDLLNELAGMAKARGDPLLANLIAMAWLHAWEVERKLAQRHRERKVDMGLIFILLTFGLAA